VENITYYGRGLNAYGMDGLIQLFFYRGVLSPYAHVLFTCMTGIGVGLSRETHNKALKIISPVVGYLIAVFLHSLWNTLATFGSYTISFSGYTVNGFVLGYIVIEAPLFLAFLGVALYLVFREKRILKESLAVEVARGLITQSQLTIVTSVFRRTGWVISAFGNGRLFSARRRFLRLVAKLGLCHWHVQRAANAGAETISFPLIARFQAEVFSLRDHVER
jgi:hypothetical protein